MNLNILTHTTDVKMEWKNTGEALNMNRKCEQSQQSPTTDSDTEHYQKHRSEMRTVNRRSIIESIFLSVHVNHDCDSMRAKEISVLKRPKGTK